MNMRRASSLLSLLLASSVGLAAGCGGDAASTLALTQRPSRGTLQCQVTRGRTDHSPRSWNSAPALVTTSGGATFLVRAESMSPATPGPPGPPQLIAGTLNAAGTFGAPTVVPSTPANVGEVAAVPRDTGFAAVYVEGTNLRFAAFDAAGAIVVAPKTVLTGVDPLSTMPAIAAGPDGGFGVVFGTSTDDNTRDVRFVTLTADGAMRGTPRVLNAPGTLLPFASSSTITSDASGYAMIWRSPTEMLGGIDFAKADAAGVETVARRRISVTNVAGTVVGGGAGFERPSTALLAVDGGYIAAWAEVNQGANFGSGASSEVRIVRLNDSGVAQGAPVPVRPGVKDIDEVEPVLVKVGAAAAIAWSRGTHIYICGGCVPDHRIDLLPIDPADLTPLGDVVSITNGAASPGVVAGGLLRKRIAVSGSSLLTTYQLTFHVHATPGSAAFTCSP